MALYWLKSTGWRQNIGTALSDLGVIGYRNRMHAPDVPGQIPLPSQQRRCIRSGVR